MAVRTSRIALVLAAALPTLAFPVLGRTASTAVSSSAQFGGRQGGEPNVRAAGGGGTEEPRARALKWLSKNQDEEGSWGAQESDQVVLTSSLVLTAFLGDGITTETGKYKDHVQRGIDWLKGLQDEEGVFRREGDASGVVGQAAALLALSEAHHVSGEKELQSVVELAARALLAARTEDGIWPGQGPVFTAEVVSTWGYFALSTAKESGVDVDEVALERISSWMSGRVAEVDAKGTSAAALLLHDAWTRSAKTDVLESRGRQLASLPPEWGKTDLQRLYHGSYAAYQLGGAVWRDWNRAMKTAVLESQFRKGKYSGSWKGETTEGEPAGRSYATAMTALTLQAYFRYPKATGLSR